MSGRKKGEENPVASDRCTDVAKRVPLGLGVCGRIRLDSPPRAVGALVGQFDPTTLAYGIKNNKNNSSTIDVSAKV